jgi:D-lactate dehydrogenase
MKVAFFSAKPYEREFFDAALATGGKGISFTYFEARLSPETASLAAGY